MGVVSLQVDQDHAVWIDAIALLHVCIMFKDSVSAVTYVDSGRL